MITIRRSDDRGQTNIGWLDSRHSFSFGDYYDPNQMGYGKLRVINDDIIAAGQGFGMHPHRDMEIITYVTEGAVAHRDSMGNNSVIRAGEVQRMTAGKGVAHSEFNNSASEALKLLQIWIVPEARSLPPSYEERSLSILPGSDSLKLIAAPGGRDGALDIHQQCEVYSVKIGAGEVSNIPTDRSDRTWIQLIRGKIRINGTETIEAGDGAAIEQVDLVSLHASETAELLIFKMAGN